MKESDLKQDAPPAKQAVTSIISAVIGWVCLGVLVLIVNAQMGYQMVGYYIPLLICLVLIAALPYNAIQRGVKAIKAGAQLQASQKALAWGGVILGALLYLVALGYVIYTFQIA